MELHQLEAFSAVMSAGSITGAGRLLGRSQPGVTRAIQDLEYELGYALFNRKGPRVTPTQRAFLLYAEVERSLAVTAFGGFLVGQQAARRMLSRGGGVLMFTGASASVKGYARSAPFAMGKFALRGLAQSMAREFAPQGIHVVHVVIDGVIRNPGRQEPPERPDSMLDPDAIADTYWHLLRQPRSSWAWEIELRPWVESF